MDENAVVLVNFSASALTASLSITESDLFLSDTLEAGKNYYMNDVYNDTVYTVTRSSLQNFNADLGPWGVRVFVLADSAFDDISTLPEKLSHSLPEQFSLDQNYPNPFNPVTQIAFSLPERTAVKLIVFDMLGREVARLIDSEMEAGNHSVRWNGRDRNNVLVGSGVYIYKLIGRGTSGEIFTRSRKMIFLK
jgi:hypothetical protein